MRTAAMQNKAPDGSTRLVAAAKINLCLHITGRQLSGDRQGYHTLDSLVVFASIGDVVTVRPSETIELRVEGPVAAALDEPVTDNLVYRAAVALSAHAGVQAGARISLKKHLPVAAGIGGGSADAAAALKSLCALWEIMPGEDDLNRIALSLGADVPVCLRGKASFMAGVGEQLTEAGPFPDTHLVLINPGVALPTAAVFKVLGDQSPTFPPVDRGLFSQTFPGAEELATALKHCRNDLEDPARVLQPVIGDVLSGLLAQPGCLLARMSGSGATCFGLFADETAAVTGADQIMSDHPDWWVVATRLVNDTDKLQELAA
jgi:4-diphosphocytidyl-2-C-methyl-D-erythritol kinase